MQGLMGFLEKEQNELSARKEAHDSFRRKAWDKFCAVGLPDRKTKGFTYVPLRGFYEREFVNEGDRESVVDVTPFILKGCENSYLSFVDGVFSPELSNFSACPGLMVYTLKEAKERFHAFFEGRLAKALQAEKDPFALLNYASGRNGAFLYLPPKKEITVPFQILLITKQKNTFVFPRVHLFAGKDSSLDLLVMQAGENNGVTNTLLDLALESGSKVKLNLIEQNTLESGHFLYVRANLKEKSLLETHSATAGSLLSRHDYHVSLEGNGAQADLSGIWSLKGKRQHHSRIWMHHKAPGAVSRQTFKGVLDGFTRSSFEGMIFVDPIAQKTEAYQLNQNLVLSEKAIAYARPNLEIFADDVKASHGATIGQIDAEQLFYLKARGIEENKAKELLIQGFISEGLHNFYPQVKELAVNTFQ